MQRKWYPDETDEKRDMQVEYDRSEDIERRIEIVLLLVPLPRLEHEPPRIQERMIMFISQCKSHQSPKPKERKPTRPTPDDMQNESKAMYSFNNKQRNNVSHQITA